MFYDPLLAKLIVWGRDRREAIDRMVRALDEMLIVGVSTTAPFCRVVLRDEQFLSGSFDTHFVADRFQPELMDTVTSEEVIAAAVAVVLQRRTSQGMVGTDEAAPRSTSRWTRQRNEH
jgi:acetyl/propionyl-CoA carboxylase alpha subunit